MSGIKRTVKLDVTENVITFAVKDELQQINYKTGIVKLDYIPVKDSDITIKKRITSCNVEDDVIDFEKSKDGKITNKNQFIVNYEEGLLSFHESQKGKDIIINYTQYAKDRISARDIWTKENSDGEVVQDLEELTDELNKLLDTLEPIGGAVPVVEELKSNIKNAETIIELNNKAKLLVDELKNQIELGTNKQDSLNRSIILVEGFYNKLNQWCEDHKDITNLNNELISVKKDLDDKVEKVEGKSLSTNDYTNEEKNQVLENKNKLIFFNNLFINVKDFGAKEDGTTDDTVAIQNIINANKGKTLVFTSNSKVSSTLTGLFDVKIIPYNNAKLIVDGTYNFYLGNQTGKTNTIYVAPSGSSSNLGLSPTNPTTLQNAFDLLTKIYKIYGDLKTTYTIQMSAGNYNLESPSIYASLSNIEISGGLNLKGANVDMNTEPTTIIDGGYNNIVSLYNELLNDNATSAEKKELLDKWRYKHGVYFVKVTNGLVSVENINMKNFKVPVEKNGVVVDALESGGTRCGLVFDNNIECITKNVWATDCDWAGIYYTNFVKQKTQGGKISRCRMGSQTMTNCKASYGYGGFTGTNGVPDFSKTLTIENCVESGINLSDGANGHIDCCTLKNNKVGIHLTECTNVNLYNNLIKSENPTSFVTPEVGLKIVGGIAYENGTSIIGYPTKRSYESSGINNNLKDYNIAGVLNSVKALTTYTTGWIHNVVTLNKDNNQLLSFYLDDNILNIGKYQFEIEFVLRTLKNTQDNAKICIYIKQGETLTNISQVNIPVDNNFVYQNIRCNISAYGGTLKCATNVNNSFSYLQQKGYDFSQSGDIVLKLEGATTTYANIYQYKITKTGI